MKEKNKKNTVKDFQTKCKNCGHTKGDHYSAVLNYDSENKTRARVSACSKKNCNCKNFEPED